MQPAIVNFDLLPVEYDRFPRRQEILEKRNALRDEVLSMPRPIRKVIGCFKLLDGGRGLSYTLTIFGERRGTATSGE